MAVYSKGREFSIDNINTPDIDINAIANSVIDRGINICTSVGFTYLLTEIANKLKPDNNDLDNLNHLFDMYMSLCAQCQILPDMTNFTVMIDISHQCLYQWLNEGYRVDSAHSYSESVKKWQKKCKSTCINEAATGNIGAIYVSKAVYGMCETAPAVVEQPKLLGQEMSAEQIAASLPSDD